MDDFQGEKVAQKELWLEQRARWGLCLCSHDDNHNTRSLVLVMVNLLKLRMMDCGLNMSAKGKRKNPGGIPSSLPPYHLRSKDA